MLKTIKALFSRPTDSPEVEHLQPILQPIDPVALLQIHQADVDRLKLDLSDEATWKEHVYPTLIAYARFVQRLPLNAKGLFADTDGLLTAGIAAARYSLMIMESYVQLNQNILSQDRLQTRMRVAALLAGLTAFIAAMLDNFEVKCEGADSFFDLAGKKATLTYSPLALAYYDWIRTVLEHRPKAAVSITWKTEPAERSIGHDLLTVYLARAVLPGHVLAWLSDASPLPLLGLLNTMAGFSGTSMLSSITKARDLGVYRACLLERERLGKALGESFAMQGWQSTLIRILRARIKEDWPINSKDSPLRMGADGLFLFWPDVLPIIIDDLKTFGLTELPHDASLWAGMMMHQAITQPSKNGTATVMIAVTPNAKPREAIKLDPHYFLQPSQWEGLKITKRDFEVTVSPAIETGLSRLTREVLGLDLPAGAIETEIRQTKPRILWHTVNIAVHPKIKETLEALMEKLTVDTRFAKASMVDEGLLLTSQSLPKLDDGFDLLVMQLLLADVIYATDKHEPLWIEHVQDSGVSVRAVVMKPTVFAIELIEDDVATELAYATLFESVFGREPQNRWDEADTFQLKLMEDDHA